MMQELDSSQRKFCEAPSGSNIRLLAPAGCGKTLCLLFRCKQLAERSLRSSRPRFLIVTFTRSAAGELQDRVNSDDRFSSIRGLVEISTLNAWGFRRIKSGTDHPILVTSSKDYYFTVRNQLRPIWKKHKRVKSAIEKKKGNTPSLLMDAIDAFKSLGFDHVQHSNLGRFSQYLEKLQELDLTWNLEAQFEKLAKLGVLDTKIIGNGAEVAQSEAKKVYDAFFKFWREATKHLMDSDTFTIEDQKYYAYLDEHQKIKEGKFLSGAARYRHVFVDEFQDINPLDFALVKAIVKRNRATITIVGDDDQAIFEWRGTTPEYILNPDKYFDSPFDTHILEVNYRSPRNIVRHSQNLIKQNTRRVSKRIRASENSGEAQIQIEKTNNLAEALEYVQNLYNACIVQGKRPSRVAIIGRKRSQIIPYQVYFASKNIPFYAAEDLQVFLSGTFDRLLDLLRIKNRDDTTQSQKQVVSDLLKLCALVKRYLLSKKDRESLLRHLQRAEPATMSDGINALSLYRGPLKGSNTEGSMSLSMAESISSFMESANVSEALLTLSEHFEGLQVDFGKAADDVFFTDPPFLQLAEYASTYGNNYDRFIDDIEQAKEQLAYTSPFEDDDEEGESTESQKRPMHLMTALRAKGKEFGTVVLLDVIDGIWPHKKANQLRQLEAERRVFYVAFTRAKQRAVMFVPTHFGDKETTISPYVQELGLSD